ncbi:hypothetical protein JYT26_01570 [Beggiatoa alba]|nr:hypothetical protein [Beggiatoa alba]
MTKKYLLLIITISLLLGCGGGNGTDPNIPVPPAQGARILGMDVQEIPSVTYAMAYNQAMSLGVREVSVSLDWSLLEPSVGSYDNEFPSIIDAFYPIQTGDITLVLRPLDTSGPSLPTELVGLTYDDPAVILAFDNFLTNLHDQLSTLNASGKLKWIHIGNEIDAYLGSDATRWAQWQIFFQAAKAKVGSLWGTGVEVSSIIQFSVLTDTNKLALYSNLLPDLDNAVLTYYPLNSDFTVRPVSTVATDFTLMVNAIPGKTILLQECGYPSSSVNNSSEIQQADFVSAVFVAWDNNINRIRFIDLSWQYDVSSSTLDQWVIDFGMTGNPNEAAFRTYLGTLGLSNFDSTEKTALQRLRDELQAREWGQ